MSKLGCLKQQQTFPYFFFFPRQHLAVHETVSGRNFVWIVRVLKDSIFNYDYIIRTSLILVSELFPVKLSQEPVK